MKTIRFSLVAAVAAFPLFATPGAPGNYVAHEWGTFTSVQGADGRQLAWNPLTVSELPGFVYDVIGTQGKDRPGSLRVYGAKTAFSTLQRMETPVIYFYAEQPQTVDVEVRFPQGLVTEWYPQARPLAKRAGSNDLPRRDQIAWDHVRVLPKGAAAALPTDGSGSHYFAARGAEANHLQVTSANGRTETEKFLFYRGVGNFRAPLTVTTADDAREVAVKNEGQEALGHLFVFQLRDGRGAFQQLEALRPGESMSIRLTPQRSFLSQDELRLKVREAMERALVAEGLYRSEAAAMVATWDDSWFAESGVRVLYTLPQAWTDRILPLTLTPAPREVARVFVGRAEVITPAMEFAVLRQLLRYHDGDAGIRNEAVTAVRALGLGRFAEPAVRRVVASVPPNREFSNHAWELLEAAAKPEARTKVLSLYQPPLELSPAADFEPGLEPSPFSCGAPPQPVETTGRLFVRPELLTSGR